MQSVTLYGHPDSGHACKVAFALALSGMPHQTRLVDIWAPPATRPVAFLAANPFAEVPVLVIDGASFVQSGSILIEIATRTGTLGGETPVTLARTREILFWEANRIGMCLPQLIESRRLSADPFPPGAVDWLRMRYDVDCARFDRLIGDQPFLSGSAPTIADCAVFGYAQWIDRAGVAPTPRMAQWLGRMRALPDYRAPQDWFPA
jgi:glutathione S-transferase